MDAQQLERAAAQLRPVWAPTLEAKHAMEAQADALDLSDSPDLHDEDGDQSGRSPSAWDIEPGAAQWPPASLDEDRELALPMRKERWRAAVVALAVVGVGGIALFVYGGGTKDDAPSIPASTTQVTAASQASSTPPAAPAAAPQVPPEMKAEPGPVPIADPPPRERREPAPQGLRADADRDTKPRSRARSRPPRERSVARDTSRSKRPRESEIYRPEPKRQAPAEDEPRPTRPGAGFVSANPY